MDFIFSGHVTVNGRVITEPSMRIDTVKDRVCLRGKIIKVQKYEYIMLNKPKDFVTTVSDPHTDKTVLSLLPRTLKHLYPVGRLDKDTEGLLILTNDGDLAYGLTHPKFNINKTYFVKIRGCLPQQKLKRLEEGVLLDGRKTASCKIAEVKSIDGQTSFIITLHEGRKRQIRRMIALVGCRVCYLKRIQQGPLLLGKLALGYWRYLTPKEISVLKKSSIK